MVSKKRKRTKSFQISAKKYISPESRKYKIAPGRIGYHGYRPYFSFRYVDDRKYTVKDFKNIKEFHIFFERLKQMSQFTWGQIFNEYRGFFHAHEVDWSDTTEKKGFSHLSQELQAAPVVQFEAFKECRVYGFFNHHNVFKIVWIDRLHKVFRKN